MTKDKIKNAQSNELASLVGQQVPDKPKNNRARWVGFLIVFVFFGGLTAWSTLAPLESAAVASGTIAVTGNRRVIQHLEGGIIQKINVVDGSVVKKNQILIQLKNTQAQARLQVSQGEIMELLGIEGRLIAERDNAEKVTFNPRLIAMANKQHRAQHLMKAQRAIFKANQSSFKSHLFMLKQKIGQIKEEIKGVQAQRESNAEQYKYIEEEVVSMTHLATRKLIERPKLLEIKRNAARLKGLQGENIAREAVLRQKIIEIGAQIETTTFERRKDILKELRETQQKIADLLKKEVVEKDVLQRTEIRSPQNGSVVSLNVHTVGGVVKPGEPLMEIVPEEKLLIEANLSPLDIDIVHKGLKAKVQLVAFKTRNTPDLLGKVVHVSADVYEDKATQQSYYKVKIELGKDQLQRLQQGQELYPGMPVQVMILTESRTLFNYLMEPFTGSFKRAFRET